MIRMMVRREFCIQAMLFVPKLEYFSKVEFFYLGQWHICNKPTFNFAGTKYRVKPEPMILYAIVNKSGSVLFVDEKREGLEVSVMKGNRIVKFIEVME